MTEELNADRLLCLGFYVLFVIVVKYVKLTLQSDFLMCAQVSTGQRVRFMDACDGFRDGL